MGEVLGGGAQKTEAEKRGGNASKVEVGELGTCEERESGLGGVEGLVEPNG